MPSRHCVLRSRRPRQVAGWATPCSAADSHFASTSGSAPVRTSAAKRQRCSRASKASAASCVPSRRCRRCEGLFGKPTVVNNVLSLATVPAILADGAAAYTALGTGRSRGTQVFQLAGNIARGGIVETAFGITLGELVNDLGGGSGSGRPIRAIQVGGPLGSYLPSDRFDLSMDYESFAAADALLGHGGIVVFDDTVDMAAQARFAMEFCAIESCGKCTPCRIGSTRGVELIDKIVSGDDADSNLGVLVDLCEVMTDGSLCAMGGLTPLPVRSALHTFHRRLPSASSRSDRMTLSLSLLTGVPDPSPGYSGDHDLGTPAPDRRLREPAPATIDITIDGQTVMVPEGTSVMRAAALAGVDVPKLCATDSLDPFGSCRLCLVEIDGRKGTPASCTTPAAPGMSVTHTVAEARAAAPRRDGAVHQRSPARLPDVRGQRRLRTARHGRRGRSARRSLRLRRRQPPRSREGHVQPVLHLRLVEVHRLLALRPGLRRGAGHVRARHRRSRLRFACRRRCQWFVPRFAVRLVRRVRAGVPHRDAHREHRHRARPAASHRADHMCVLRRRLLVQGRDAGRAGRADGAVQGRRRERRPLVRQGAFRLGLRQPPRPHARADDPREHRRPVADRRRGTRPSRTPRPSCSRSRPVTATRRSAASPRRAAPTKRSSWCRRWCALRSATTTSTPVHASATRRPASG